MAAATASRIARLADQLSTHGWEAFLGWAPVTNGYLHGFFEGSHERFMALCIHRSGKVALIAPALSATQASRHGIHDVRAWTDNEDPYALVSQLAAEWGLGDQTVALDNEMPAHMVLGIQRTLPNTRFVLGEEAIAALRRVKGADELELMRRSGAIADAVYEAVLPHIKPGITEVQLEDLIRSEIKARGATSTFCSVAFGAAAAEPHHLNDDTALTPNTLVLMDFGCDLERYQSDITRVVCCGQASDKMKAVYGIVHRAFMAGREAAKVGVAAQEVDRAARRVIAEAGYGEYFIHRTGHGVGMQVHEHPNMVEGNTHVLETGNCFSVEPGIYLPGEFGVRIENLVYASDAGCISFNAEPSPTLIEL